MQEACGVFGCILTNDSDIKDLYEYGVGGIARAALSGLQHR